MIHVDYGACADEPTSRERRGMGASTHTRRALELGEQRRRQRAGAIIFTLVALALAAIFACAGCSSCGEVRAPAAQIARDLELIDELKGHELTPEQKVKLSLLEADVRKNVRLLAEASK